MSALPEREPAIPEKFPFGADFQKALIRLICEDDDFAHAVGKFIKPHHFESEVLAWAFSYIQRHRESFNASPSLSVLLHQTKSLDSKIQVVYSLAVEDIQKASLRDELWLREKVLDFVKRNIFVQTFNECRGLYNTGKVVQAYDVMMDRMEELVRVTWEPTDETLFFDDLARRQARRMQVQAEAGPILTGFGWLDSVLDGGLSPGELGIWIAYPKHGKSTMLMTLGKNAVAIGMRPTAHFVLEGSRWMVENRYDAAFMNELYTNVKTGEIDSDKYHKGYRNYQILKGLLVIRGFTDRFDYSVLDIQQALKDMQQRYNFKPHHLIVDYGDLLNGRDSKGYRNETEKQKAAFRDLKVLSSRGYAIWTASQAQRPSEKDEQSVHLLKARNIADCYEKIRVADFIGSLNQTEIERKAKVMRIHAELYRDNEAGKTLMVSADFQKMQIKQDPKLLANPEVPASAPKDPALGYKPQQMTMPG